MLASKRSAESGSLPTARVFASCSLGVSVFHKRFSVMRMARNGGYQRRSNIFRQLRLLVHTDPCYERVCRERSLFYSGNDGLPGLLVIK